MTTDTTLTTTQEWQQLAYEDGRPLLKLSAEFWAKATSDAASPRYLDIIRDKQNMLVAFFDHCQKVPGKVTEKDVLDWQQELKDRGLAPATVYAYVSRISSFYTWAQQDPGLAQSITRNPVTLARPKAPQPYATEKTKALSREELLALVQVVKDKAASGDIVGLRDYAILRLFVATGWRRNEIIQLHWGDIVLNGAVTIRARLKGGKYKQRVVRDPGTRDAIVDYLQASGRWGSLSLEDPLWTRHDRAGEPGEALTSHAYAKNLKAAAQEAGLAHFNLHQLRHTHANQVYQLSGGSETAVQEELNHSNLATTRQYISQVVVQEDRYSVAIADLLGL